MDEYVGEVWEIPEYLCEIPHTSILTKSLERRLGRWIAGYMMRGVWEGLRSADFSLARRESSRRLVGTARLCRNCLSSASGNDRRQKNDRLPLGSQRNKELVIQASRRASTRQTRVSAPAYTVLALLACQNAAFDGWSRTVL